MLIVAISCVSQIATADVRADICHPCALPASIILAAVATPAIRCYTFRLVSLTHCMCRTKNVELLTKPASSWLTIAFSICIWCVVAPVTLLTCNMLSCVSCCKAHSTAIDVANDWHFATTQVQWSGILCTSALVPSMPSPHQYGQASTVGMAA